MSSQIHLPNSDYLIHVHPNKYTIHWLGQDIVFSVQANVIIRYYTVDAQSIFQSPRIIYTNAELPYYFTLKLKAGDVDFILTIIFASSVTAKPRV